MTRTYTTQPNTAHINLSALKPTPYSQLSPKERKKRAKNLAKERDAAARKEMERNLRLMLDYVGLEDEPTSVLGGTILMRGR